MKQYPSIPPMVSAGGYIYAFDKLDGSNIRAEFSPKKGFTKFGSRKRLLGTDQGVIVKAEDCIKAQSDLIEDICKKNRWQSVILFYEFFGKNSKFGVHDKNDEHIVKLIDAAPYKHGMLPPKDFIKAFSDIDTANLLYHGPCDKDFILSVKNSTLEGMTYEGVVCKAKGKNTVDMFKIKSEAWYEDLKIFCHKTNANFNELA